MNMYTNDQIARMSNEDLRNLFFSLRAQIHTSHKKGEDCKSLEVYYCYVSRELEHRENLRNINATCAMQ